MGRIFRSFVDDADDEKYCCNTCGCDVASASSVVWEGFMGAQKPAVLLRKVVNVDPYAEPRRERLSTGEYRLVDVWCRVCLTPLGWTYLTAAVQEQKYKEGASLLSQCRLQRIAPGAEFVRDLANKSASAESGDVDVAAAAAAAATASYMPADRRRMSRGGGERPASARGPRALARSTTVTVTVTTPVGGVRGRHHDPPHAFGLLGADTADLADLPALLRGGALGE